MSAPSQPPDFAPSPEAVFSRIGVSVDPTDRCRGRVEVNEAIVRHGQVRRTALMLAADMVVGMDVEIEVPEWIFTSDFSLRMADLEPIAPGSMIEVTSRRLRAGRRLSFSELDFRIGDTELGHAQVSFLRADDRPDVPPKPDMAAIRAQVSRFDAQPLPEPVEVAAGIEIVDAATGHVRLDPHDGVRRPGGFVQGAMMCLVGEIAGEAMGEAAFGRPCTITDLDVRYLIGGRSGPLETVSRFIGAPERGVIYVEVHDRGHDCITNTFHLRVAPLTA